MIFNDSGATQHDVVLMSVISIVSIFCVNQSVQGCTDVRSRYNAFGTSNLYRVYSKHLSISWKNDSRKDESVVVSWKKSVIFIYT